ncbi:hypothetical protein FRC06_008257, partial [Ceratobasidium sp. 370]
LVYLRLSGRLSFDSGKVVRKSFRQSQGLNYLASWTVHGTTSSLPASESGSKGVRTPRSTEVNQVGKHLKKIARRLMLYPFVYSIVTIPVAICRLGVMAGWTPPFPLYVFAGITFSSSGLTNVLLFIVTRHSFIQQVAIRPRVHVTTQQVTVLEDSRGVQTIQLHELPAAIPSDEQGGTSEKADLERDGSFKLKQQMPDVEGDAGTPTVGVRFLTKEWQ